MAANRPAVGLVVAMLLVWSVAFGGGYSLALFSTTANVSGTFEAAEEFTPIEPDVDAALAKPAGPVPAGQNESIGNDDPLGEPPGSGGNATDAEPSDGNATHPGTPNESPESPGNESDESEPDPIVDTNEDNTSGEGDTSDTGAPDGDNAGDDTDETDDDPVADDSTDDGDGDPDGVDDENGPVDDDTGAS